ncbi:MAG: OmpA family protein, partial [Deltaproteobacteria bacterium]|nr:OmpA family protein [Deltaproteobacteria bacterium]
QTAAIAAAQVTAKKAPKKPSADIATEDAAKKAKPAPPPPSMMLDDDSMGPPPLEAEEGAPLWVVTFADLMSLLMCFFVMLLSMSSMEITTFKKMVESMKRGLGQSMSTEMEEFGVEQILSEAQILQAAAREQTRKQSAEMRQILKQEINDGKIEVEEGDQQITIQILQAGSFSAGSATLKKSFVSISTKLKNSLDKIPGAITVAGHTDNQPMSTRQFRSNWELSSARAFSVIHSLLKRSDLKPERFVLRGFAETRPRVPNDTPQNRGKNRRVEIIIDQRESSNITGTDNPDNLERIIINAETLENYHRDHVRPINSVGKPPPAAPAPTK